MHQQRRSLSWLRVAEEQELGQQQQELEPVLDVEQPQVLGLEQVLEQRLEQVLEQQWRHRSPWQP
jgi:hypothetical protein